ncbi:MAG: DNA-processing protein DprA [Variovorax sp.]
MDATELGPWLRLALTPGVGDQAARRLLAAFGSPPHVFAASMAALEQVVGRTQARALHQVPEALEALQRATWHWLHEDADESGSASASGASGDIARRIVTLGDADYPRALLDTADPPLMLYLLGPARFDLDRLQRSIALVGSRNPTPQGAGNARAFARAFAERGITVVSGLALGIDGAAHEGALEGWPVAGEAATHPATVAVVGTGLDRVYPARHRALAHRIAQSGLIISEFPLGTPPLSQNFPRRNRLIAGLARGTLVAEAALASGSLVTAQLTVEQGKDVFAIPGSIHSPQSRGCHALIRQGAKLVERASDVLEELRWADDTAQSQCRADQSDGDLPNVSGAARPLLDALGYDPVSLDALSARSGWSAGELQAQLLELELEGHVARLPGGLFQRVGAA